MDLVFAANGPANAQMELCGVGHIPLRSLCSSLQMRTHNKKVALTKLPQTCQGLDGARTGGTKTQN